MWYAVETAFMNGRMLKSVPIFDLKTDENTTGRAIPGTCPLSHDEEPHNTCQKFLNGLVEIHTDWFQTKKQAMQFIKRRHYLYHALQGCLPERYKVHHKDIPQMGGSTCAGGQAALQRHLHGP